MLTSIDLSNVVELRSLSDIVETLNDSARGIVERWLIVGATARDLILHHLYHLHISRATIDLDIAVAVPSWVAFEVLQKELLKRGAELHPRITHRFVMKNWQIDIIPFGGIEQDGVIFWPPSNDTKMSVLGFDEASRNALNVTFRAGVTAAVASLPALLILKLFAWEGRHRDLPKHDAYDIRLLVASYSESWNQDRLYEEADDLLQRYGYDTSLAAAALLGRDARAIAKRATLDHMRVILENEVSNDALALPADMGLRADENLALLEALLFGISGNDE